MVSFTTTLWSAGGNNVGIVVPPEVVASFGRGKRVPVRVTVDEGYSYRSTIAVMGGQHLISFNAETRARTGRAAGDEVTVTLELDDEPRTVELPEALAEALAADPAATAAWQRLSPSRQKAHALAVAGAKTDATRERRLAAVLAELASGA